MCYKLIIALLFFISIYIITELFLFTKITIENNAKKSGADAIINFRQYKNLSQINPKKWYAYPIKNCDQKKLSFISDYEERGNLWKFDDYSREGIIYLSSDGHKYEIRLESFLDILKLYIYQKQEIHTKYKKKVQAKVDERTERVIKKWQKDIDDYRSEFIDKKPVQSIDIPATEFTIDHTKYKIVDILPPAGEDTLDYVYILNGRPSSCCGYMTTKYYNGSKAKYAWKAIYDIDNIDRIKSYLRENASQEPEPVNPKEVMNGIQVNYNKINDILNQQNCSREDWYRYQIKLAQEGIQSYATAIENIQNRETCAYSDYNSYRETCAGAEHDSSKTKITIDELPPWFL